MDEKKATRFLRACVKHFGLGFHPDTPFGDYGYSDGRDCFTRENADRHDERMEEVFGVLADPYEVASRAMEELYPGLFKS